MSTKIPGASYPLSDREGIIMTKHIYLFFAHAQGTDAGILGDDMQRLLRFATAVGLVTKSSSRVNDDLHELSHQLEACLITITSVMRRVVSCTLYLLNKYIFFWF